MLCDVYPSVDELDQMAKVDKERQQYRDRVKAMLEELRTVIAKAFIKAEPINILVVARQWVLLDVMRVTSEEWQKVFGTAINGEVRSGWGHAFQAGYIIDFATNEDATTPQSYTLSDARAITSNGAKRGYDLVFGVV
ncbi:hypothetical protein AVT69_gp128 [Pseudomonas phage PhiPA3]|uniref:Uncharacterized protein 129 n=1 Tax=Pseudomonas phage PhiPA3 TaxID=998086 RepID=F8SK03_BPPA3|nr:hypothetical protein AVT69_gp128 [Pseudomonas phage PhiPA3]AEH03553.1 hypothetical protein [Pseudomonas phage PhiPA3]